MKIRDVKEKRDWIYTKWGAGANCLNYGDKWIIYTDEQKYEYERIYGKIDENLDYDELVKRLKYVRFAMEL